jgi:hypothetical protein
MAYIFSLYIYTYIFILYSLLVIFVSTGWLVVRILLSYYLILPMNIPFIVPCLFKKLIFIQIHFNKVKNTIL